MPPRMATRCGKRSATRLTINERLRYFPCPVFQSAAQFTQWLEANQGGLGDAGCVGSRDR